MTIIIKAKYNDYISCDRRCEIIDIIKKTLEELSCDECRFAEDYEDESFYDGYYED